MESKGREVDREGCFIPGQLQDAIKLAQEEHVSQPP